MPQKDKKSKRDRPAHYEEKVALKGTFEQAIKFLANKANRNSASPQLAQVKK